MADTFVDYPYVDEEVGNLMGEQYTHVCEEQSTSKTLSQLEAHMAKMAETMSGMGDVGIPTKKRNLLDADS